MHRNENVVAATKLPSPAALEVTILTTSSAASDENLRNCRFCAWAIWKHGHVDHPMPMLAVEVVIATTRAIVSDQRVATAPTSPNHRFFALNCRIRRDKNQCTALSEKRKPIFSCCDLQSPIITWSGPAFGNCFYRNKTDETVANYFIVLWRIYLMMWDVMCCVMTQIM